MSLELNDITLTYPDGDGTVTALDSVSLRAGAGELVVVAGPSGSGKSSLLAVAGTLLRPSAGRLWIDGADVTMLGLAARSRLRLDRIGIVFQQANLLGSLTAIEQLLATDHMRGLRARHQEAHAAGLLESVGLAGKEHRKPHQLSGGERQRVNIARALTGDPSVLLVDEPTAALDHERGQRIVSLIADVTKTFRVATVLVTHDLELVDGADKVVRLRDGRVVS